MTENKPVYLRMLDIESNHYKYYRMIPSGDSFTAEWGREGSKPQTKVYPMSQWAKIYREKTKKGYEDKTDHFVIEKVESPTDISRISKTGDVYAVIKDESVRELVKQLMELSNAIVSSNYNIGSEHVTQKMIDDAQICIDRLANVYTKLAVVKEPARAVSLFEDYNNALLQLINIVPRKIKRVKEYLLAFTPNISILLEAMRNQISFEEDLLNNMRTKVSVANIIAKPASTVSEEKAKETTLLEALGLVIEPCSAEDMKRIMSKFTSDDAYANLPRKVKTAWRVTNLKTEKAFENFKQEFKDDYKRFPCNLLWHGSRNENWWSIINTGLKIRPSGAVYTGSMFGDGVYFANKARKSFNYTSSRNAYYVQGNAKVVFMALFDVATGNSYNVNNNYSTSSMTWNKLRALNTDKKYHSLFAHSGAQLINDELVMYRNDQMTIRYLVMFDA